MTAPTQTPAAREAATRETAARPPGLRRAVLLALAAAALGIVGCALTAIFAPQTFFRSWLTAWLFWWAMAIGSAALLMLHTLTGGRWGLSLRRLLEAGTLTLPLLALLFVPLLFGLPELFPWARPEEVADDPTLRARTWYLGVPFWTGRAAGFFVLWGAFGLPLVAGLRRAERAGDLQPRGGLRGLAGAGLIVVGLTTLFAAVDWVMSVETIWYSTIIGLLVLVGDTLSMLALATLVVTWLLPRGAFGPGVGPERLNDLGNLLLALVMLWAYLAWSQYLITWSGDLPEEIAFYIHRFQPGWRWVGWALVLVHFAVPFLLLLSRAVKRRALALAGVAGLLLVMRALDWLWLTRPSAQPSYFAVYWADLAAPLAVGGLWMAAWLWLLGRRPLVPAAAREELREDA